MCATALAEMQFLQRVCPGIPEISIAEPGAVRDVASPDVPPAMQPAFRHEQGEHLTLSISIRKTEVE